MKIEIYLIYVICNVFNVHKLIISRNKYRFKTGVLKIFALDLKQLILI